MKLGVNNKFSNIELGKFGEQLACKFLQKKGMKLIAKNLLFKQGEIDLLMLDGDVHVIVEVKTRQVSPHAEKFIFDNVDLRKKKKLISLMESYLRSQKRKSGNIPKHRIDLVGVIIRQSFFLKAEKIIHLKGAL